MSSTPTSPLDSVNSRQALYDRIRESSKDSVILEEMLRLGFWNPAEPLPQDPPEEVQRRSEIEKSLNALYTERSRLHNMKAMLKEWRKRKLAESRQKQLETKQRLEQQRLQRRAAWQQRKQSEVVFLGEQVSAGLNHQESQSEQLAKFKLPVCHTPLQLAEIIAKQIKDFDLKQLRFLTFQREVSTISHYQRFQLVKKSGGLRTISAPMPRLKAVQHWILHNILNVLPLHDAAHGFRSQRSIVSNAQPHVKQAIVLNLDLKDFFPTVSYRRVKGVFQQLGYSEAVATHLALLCTVAETEEVHLDGERYFVEMGQRVLAQGAPTSPALTNFLCRRLDSRLAGLARKLGFNYSRYADDLTFSGTTEAKKKVNLLLRQIHFVVAEEGFNVHPDKTRVMHSGRRQEVTGLVVNEKPAVSREQRRELRAVLFHLVKDGVTGKAWKGFTGDALLHHVSGMINFIAMVNPQEGEKLRGEFAKIKK